MKHCYLFLVAAFVSAAAVWGTISFHSSNSSDLDSLFLAETLAIAQGLTIDEDGDEDESTDPVNCTYVVCTPSRNYEEIGIRCDGKPGGDGCFRDPECLEIDF